LAAKTLFHLSFVYRVRERDKAAPTIQSQTRRKKMKALALAMAAATIVGLGAAAPSYGALVEVNVFDRSSGQQLPTYRYRGDLYVVGTPGNKYSITLRNGSGAPVLSVVSVDGVNVVTGETAQWSQSGYVLAPYGYTEINGWRKSLRQVAAFVFAPESQSYASKTQRPDNVGVIGVAVFQSRQEPPMVLQRPEAGAGNDAAESAASPAAPAARSKAMADSAAKEERLGTGHGAREWSRATYTSFERATTEPAQVIRIYYDSYRNLVAKGVIPQPPVRKPDPFPGQFVPDPQG
jgi:hypothetical protein